MADGVRIQPQPARLEAENIDSAANRLFILRDRSRPLTPGPDRHVCNTCGVPHECKTYHLQMGGDGTVIVSARIWQRLQQMPDHGGFEAVNVVTKPPAQELRLPPVALDLRPRQPGTKKRGQ